MPLDVRHKYVSPVASTGDPDIVQGPDWNEGHNLVQGPSALLGRSDAAPGQAPTQEVPLDGTTLEFTVDGKLGIDQDWLQGQIDDAIGALPPNDWDSITGKPATFPPSAHGHPSTEITDFAEAVDDRVATLIVGGTNITKTYNDVANTLTIAAAAYPTALPPSGTAGGDLSGSYPNPLIKPGVTNGHVLTTVAGAAAWAAASGGASISVGIAPPGSPTAGALWWNSDASTGGGQLMIFYNDGSTTQWVPASPGMSTPTTPGGDFCAILATGPAINATPSTLIPTTIISGNTGSYYNTVNGRWTPPAGRYAVECGFCGHNTTGGLSNLVVGLIKNGTALLANNDGSPAAYSQANPRASLIVDANGTDWFSMQGWSDVASSTASLFFQAFPISGVKGPPGDPGVGLLQTVSYQTGAFANGTTVIPYDDTIPQISEGTEFMTLAITPRSATSKLIVTVHAAFSHSVPTAIIGALFQDSTANALAAMYLNQPLGNQYNGLSFAHTMTSGTTSPINFRFRAGGNAAGTLTFNGASGARLFGGVMASSIVIQEVL